MITPVLTILASIAPAWSDSDPIVFQGFTNTPLGQACLTVDPVLDTLTISNIGSSGLDGVSVDVSDPYFEFELELAPADASPDGARLEFKSFGSLNGVPDQLLWTLRLEDLGDHYGLFVDHTPLAIPSLDLHANQLDFAPDMVQYVPAPDPTTLLATFETGTLHVAPSVVFGVFPTIGSSIYFEAFESATLPDGTGLPVVVSDLFLTGDPSVAPFGPITRHELLARDLPQVLVEEESASAECHLGFGGGSVVYCTAKTSSAGCIGTLAQTAFPGCPAKSGDGDYFLSATNLQGFHNGIFFFGMTSRATLPFSGGVLCTFPPLGRSPIQNSAGTSFTSCDGSFLLEVNDGGPWDAGAGNMTWLQGWYRDPQNGQGNLGTALTDAIEVPFF